jgi:hypothetical protein
VARVFELRNARSIDALCNFTVWRYITEDDEPLLASPCNVCVIAGRFCNMVSTKRIFNVVNQLNIGWDYEFANSAQGTLIRDLLTPWILVYDPDEGSAIYGTCVWWEEETDTGGGITVTVTRTLTVTVNVVDSSKVDMSLLIEITVTGEYSDSFSITYTAEEVRPDVGFYLLETEDTPENRRWEIVNEDYLEFPVSMNLSPEDLP